MSGRGAPASLLASVLVAAVGLPAAPPGEPRLAVEVRPVPLNPLDPGQGSIGRLAYRGGLWLRSDDPRFGGWSDLRVAPDRRRFWAISDCGSVLEAGLAYDRRGFLTGIVAPHLDPLLGEGGRPLEKKEIDAEALAGDGEGGFVVAFEDRPRLWRYPAPAGLRGSPTPLPTPAGLTPKDGNAGIEAMTRLPDGRLLVITEGPRGRPRATAGWIGRGDVWTRFSYPLVYDEGAPKQPFRPTSLATLPRSRDVLVLERRYPPVAVRIRRVARAAFERGTGLEGVEVARLDPPLSVDNFEGIDAVAGPRREKLVFLISDDNNCAKKPGALRRSLQRTLLLLFALS